MHACSGNSCSVARLTTPRRNFEEERREREEACSIAFFSLRGSPASSSEGRETVGNFQPARRLVGEKFLPRENYALGPCIMYSYGGEKADEGAWSGPGRKYSKGAWWWCCISLPSLASLASCPSFVAFLLLLLLLFFSYGWKGGG